MTAEYAVSVGIDYQPAFSWWVHQTLKVRDKIVVAATRRMRQSKFKFGVEVPRDLDHVKKLDTDNGNTFWMDALKLGMTNLVCGLHILDDDEVVPVGWKQSSGHLIFDIKMDFTRKARWVKDGHKTPKFESSTFAGVVGQDSIRIALTYAALNDLDAICADI